MLEEPLQIILSLCITLLNSSNNARLALKWNCSWFISVILLFSPKIYFVTSRHFQVVFKLIMPKTLSKINTYNTYFVSSGFWIMFPFFNKDLCDNIYHIFENHCTILKEHYLFCLLLELLELTHVLLSGQHGVIRKIKLQWSFFINIGCYCCLSC